jgi:diaminopimelate decarboxylase/aspartate kinase
VRVTLDSVHPLAHHPEVFEGQRFNVRVDPGRGQGHHRHVRTAGAQSKFGVVPGELGRLRTLAGRVGATVVGLHAHVGSGITEAETWGTIATTLAELAADFPAVEVLNVGGGLGVPVQPEAPGLDLEALAEVLAEVRRRHPRYALWMEPGRYVVAEAGVLLARVTQTKTKGAVHYVGLDAGMHVLLRPALYGAYHPIVNLSRLDAPMAVTAEVVGPICESGDVLGHSRRLPATEEGDVLVITTTGAYGAAMQMGYNVRDAARETVLR